MRVNVLLASALALMVAGAAFWLLPNLSTRCEANPQHDMMALAAALTIYRYDTGSFPTTAEGLAALAVRPAGSAPGWRKRLDEVPRDLWGSPFVYRFPSPEDPKRFELISLGPDRVPSADDVRYRWREPAVQPNPALQRTPTAGNICPAGDAHTPQ